jgi:hypothetical protein
MGLTGVALGLESFTELIGVETLLLVRSGHPGSRSREIDLFAVLPGLVNNKPCAARHLRRTRRARVPCMPPDGKSGCRRPWALMDLAGTAVGLRGMIQMRQVSVRGVGIAVRLLPPISGDRYPS